MIGAAQLATSVAQFRNTSLLSVLEAPTKPTINVGFHVPAGAGAGTSATPAPTAPMPATPASVFRSSNPMTTSASAPSEGPPLPLILGGAAAAVVLLGVIVLKKKKKR